MAVTLLESRKIGNNGPAQSAIIEEFALSSDILTALPFDNILGGAYRYNREDTLPGIGFRGVNQSYQESTGIVNPQVETLSIAGGDLDVDRFLTATNGPSVRSTQELMKAKALGLRWTREFIKGDSSSDPTVFDGLQMRVTGSQLLSAGATAGGDALSLGMIDDLIDLVDGATHIVCNKKVRNLLSSAARSASVAGYVSYELNQFGQRVMYYNGLPLLICDYDNENNQIMGFTEANPGGGTPASTSIYAVAIDPMKLHGIQSSAMTVTDLGELQTKPATRTRIEWYSGFVIKHGRAAARLQGIKNAPVAA
jgi:hypothetical protein